MQNRTPAIIRFILLVVALVELYAEFTHWRELMFFTKPLLLPLIAAYYFASLNGNWNVAHKLMLFAFLFSWFGDISLMLTPETTMDTHLMGIPKNKNFFLAGLSSFLVTQVLFIIAYKKAMGPSRQSSLSRVYYLVFPVYLLIILMVVLPPLQGNPEKQQATIPVIFYAVIITWMAATAFGRFGKTNSKSFWLTFIGACVFVVSDSLIAVNFLALAEPTYYAGCWIMLTYIMAEYLIAEGILKHYESNS